MQKGKIMDAEHKILYKIRSQISNYAYQTEILLNKIHQYEDNAEVMALSEIGITICKKIKRQSEKCGLILEKIQK